MNKEYWDEFLKEKPKDEFSKNLKFAIQHTNQKEVIENLINSSFLLYGSIGNLRFHPNESEYVKDFNNRLFDFYLWLEIIDYYYNQSEYSINNESYNRQLSTLKSFVEQLKNR